MSRNKEVYPISAQLEEDLEEQRIHFQMQKLPESVQMMVEAIGEYEHGTADIEDLLPELWEELTAERMDISMSDEEEEQIQVEARKKLLRAAAAVVQDMALTILAQS